MSILIVVEGNMLNREQKKLWKHRAHPPSHPPKIVDLFSLVKHLTVLLVIGIV